MCIRDRLGFTRKEILDATEHVLKFAQATGACLLYTSWQVDFTTGIKVWQFHETCAENRNNTVKKSSKLVAKYLKDIRYSDKAVSYTHLVILFAYNGLNHRYNRSGNT